MGKVSILGKCMFCGCMYEDMEKATWEESNYRQYAKCSICGVLLNIIKNEEVG